MKSEPVNILLVDDRPENLLALESVLEPLEENLIMAHSGDEALRHVLEHDFAVVLMDARMPGMDGYETTRLLHGRERNSTTPIIFITANDPEGLHIENGYAAGAVDYIVKPFPPEILRSKVRVFTNLMRKSREVEHQAKELKKRNEYQQQLIEKNQILEKQLSDRAAEAESRAELLRILAIELTHAEQLERQRLSRFLHDHLQQLLVAAMYKVSYIERELPGEKMLSADLKELNDLLRQTVEYSRTLTIELSPPILDEGGLAPAFEWLARQMQELHKLDVNLELKLNGESPSDSLKMFLFQSTRELLFNVFKHAGVSDVKLSLVIDGGEINLCVEDHGNGFDVGRLKENGRQFESFGLTSIRERIEIFGGEFQLHSQPGEGTQINLRVPLKYEHRRNRPFTSSHREVHKGSKITKVPDEPGMGRHRILVVDDQNIVCQSLSVVLSNHYDIEIVGQAFSGEEAIKMARENSPNVVVMDVSLPGMNGLEATRRIVEEFPDMRVIAISMYESTEVEQLIMKAGASMFLLKSESADRLVSSIRGANIDAIRQCL